VVVLQRSIAKSGAHSRSSMATSSDEILNWCPTAESSRPGERLPGRRVCTRLPDSTYGKTIPRPESSLITSASQPSLLSTLRAGGKQTIGSRFEIIWANRSERGGGALISYRPFGLGWQAIFLVNVPVGVLALLGAWRFVPENAPPRAASLDLQGVALLSLFLALVIYPLTHGRESGWSAWLLFTLAASLPVFAIFLWTERRLKREGRDPLVDLDLFRNPAFTAALALAFLFYCDSVFFLTYGIYLQTGLGWSPIVSGIAIMPFAIGLLVGPLSSPALANRIHGHVLTVGFGLMALGFSTVALAARLSTVPTAPFYAGLVAAGIGHGIVLPSIVRIALMEADQTKSGLASGVVISTLQIGSAFGTAAISGLFFAALGKQTTPTAYALAFRSGVTANAALLFVCVLLCLWLVRYQRGRDRARLHIRERDREGVTIASCRT
jgi:Na+/melibiose symporter-like transporter